MERAHLIISLLKQPSLSKSEVRSRPLVAHPAPDTFLHKGLKVLTHLQYKAVNAVRRVEQMMWCNVLLQAEQRSQGGQGRGLRCLLFAQT